MNKKQMFQGVCIAGLFAVVGSMAYDVIFPPKAVSKYANQNLVVKTSSKQWQAISTPVNGMVTTSIEGNKRIETTTYTTVATSPERVEMSTAPFLTQDYTDNLKTIQATYQKRLDLEQKDIELKLHQLAQESSEIAQLGGKPSNPVVFSESVKSDVYSGSMPKNLSTVNDIFKAPNDSEIAQAFSDLSVGSISSSGKQIEVWLNYNGGYVNATKGTSFGPYKVTSVTADSVVIYHNDLHVSKTIGNSIHTASARSSSATSSSVEMKLPPAIDNKQ
jgi:hypothetical protein